MKTIVGLFDHRSDADAAVRDLVDLGIDRDDISLVASDGTQSGVFPPDSARSDRSTVATSSADRDVPYTRTNDEANATADGALAGAAIGGVGGLLLSLSALAIPGIGPVVAAGPLVAGLVGAGVGAAVGGLVGALTEVGVPEEQAGYFAEGVRRGGTLVSVTANDEETTNIVDVLNRHDPVNVDERASMWRQEGWTGFSEQAAKAPYATSSNFGTSSAMDRTSRERASDASYDRTRQMNSQYVADADTDEVRMPGRIAQSTQYGDNELDFRRHYQTTYAGTGRAWEDYAPAYRYGYDLSSDTRYRGRNWSEIEADVQRDWNSNNNSKTWEDFKDAVREGWERTKHAVGA